MSNRKDKIIEVSIELFNTKGAINTTTRHICSELNISVGNLYYYFKNKEEIIITIFEKFMSELGRFLTSVDKDVDSVFDYTSFLKSQMQFEYKYRFIRLEMANIITSYPILRNAMENGIGLKMQQLRYLYKHQMKYGYLKKLDEQELDFHVSNTWIIGSQWELFWILTKCKDEKIRRKNGLLNMLYFMKPYFTKKGLEKSNVEQHIKSIQKDIHEVN